MTTEMTRQEWLEAEIEFARTDVARLQESDDPIQQMYAARRRRDADDLQHELDQLRTAVSLSIRLAGGEIEDDRAPIDVVRDVVARLGDLADEFGANMLVAPAKPGSHVIEVTGSNARTLFEDDPTFSEDAAFVAAARSVIDLAESPWGGESGWERQIEDKAADFSDAGIRAARGFLHALSTNGIRAELHLSSTRSAAKVSFDPSQAAFVERVLNDVSREVKPVDAIGVLSGFTKGTLRFEITLDDGTEVHGRVPRSLRDLANGIAIDTRVRITADEVTTHLKSGGSRRFLRLVDIAPTGDHG